MIKIWERVKNCCVQKGRHSIKPSRADLEKKVVEGANKTLKQYKRVFERLAEHDRT
jgi:hypothetical protein